MLLSLGLGVVAWFSFLTLLRRLLLQPDLLVDNKAWLGFSVFMVSVQFTVAVTVPLINESLLDISGFLVILLLFFSVSVMVCILCARKISK